MNRRLIIYDAGQNKDFKNTIKTHRKKGEVWFSVSPTVKFCVGCFNCWTKTPGKCIISDRCQYLPAYVALCSEVVIISPVLYGCYSPEVKAVIDRMIPYILPYFRIVNGNMHHKPRYENSFKLSVYFYGCNDDREKLTAKKLVEANMLNFNAKSAEVKFYNNISEIEKVLI